MAQYIKGCEVKVALNVEKIGDVTMNDYDFNVAFFTQKEGTRIVLQKNECVDVGDGTYAAIVDTTSLDVGTLNALLTAYIPDADCEDGLRTEKALYKITDCKIIEV